MLIKVCGILQNANAIAQLADMVGFIYYPGSPRFTRKAPPTKGALRVGVFVNEEAFILKLIADRDELDMVQLHGNETPETCAAVRERTKVIKAVSVASESDFEAIKEFSCDYFLFDTKGTKQGGNGIKFDWTLLEHYTGQTPFLLSGGIGPEDMKRIKQIRHRQFAGIDLNSRFETAPGVKDVQLIKTMIDELRS